MRPHTHPPYLPVAFRDRSADTAFLTRSTPTHVRGCELDREGRVRRFRRRCGSAR